MIKLKFAILISLLLGSCVTFKHHEFAHTPRKPGRYPAFSLPDHLSGHPDELRAGYDVTFYDLDLHIDPDKHTLGGKVTIHLTALTRLVKFRFDLHRNFEISSLTFSGTEIPYVREELAVIASLPDTLETGNSYSLVVTYEGEPVRSKNPPWSGGIVWDKDKNGNPWVGVVCEKTGASIWFPCKDHLSDEPDSVRLRMTLPAGLQLISNGIMEKHTVQPGSETFTWRTHYPVNIYNITFYVGKFEHFSDTMKTGEGILNLDYYVMPENLQRAKQHFMQVKDYIRIYSESFGPYPWINEGFKLVEGPFEGMEHQTAIAYGSGYTNLPSLGGDYIIAHETAHEWWGNAISVSDFCDIWLQEGFATYSELIFTEYKKGYDSSLLYARHYLAGMINNKLPVVGPPATGYWNDRDNDVYNKGALVLHTIRNIVNDSTLFFDILKTFYSEHAAKSHVTTSDFIEVVERKTGKEWDIFFEVYLYRREVPVLRWCSGSFENTQDSDIATPNVPFVVAEWINVPEGFTMPVSVDCSDSEASEIIEVSAKPSIFFLKNNASCNKPTLNKNFSYFDILNDKSLLKEIETGD